MTTFNEGRHPGEFLMSEAEGFRSRGRGTIKAGSGIVEPGTILGRLVTGAASSAVKAGGANTGNGALILDATEAVQHGAKAGVYTVRCSAAAANGGTFDVKDPDGFDLGQVAVAGTFNNDIKFAIADGATDFVVGDGFDITVAAGSGKYAPSPDAQVVGIEGAETAVAVALYGGDATSVDVDIAVIERDAEVNAGALVYDASVDDGDKQTAKVAQLAAMGIIAR